jgi:gas vesicle protein
VGKSAEELRRDIEMTREDLGGTIEAIGDRVSPGRIIERRKNRFTNGVQSVRYRVMGTAGDAGHAVSDRAHHAADTVTSLPETAKYQTQGSPMAAGLIAFGAGFLAAAVIPSSQRERQATEKLMEKAEPLKEKLSEAGHEMADNLKEDARQAAAEVKESASEHAAQVKDTAQQATHQGQSQQSGFQDRGGA